MKPEKNIIMQKKGCKNMSTQPGSSDLSPLFFVQAEQWSGDRQAFTTITSYHNLQSDVHRLHYSPRSIPNWTLH
jgi:hypothetical protein